MQSLHTTAHFEVDGSVTLKAPGLAAPGDHKVLTCPGRSGISSHGSHDRQPGTVLLMRIWDNEEDDIYDTL